MSISGQRVLDVPVGLGLRAELSVRNLRWAMINGFVYERTDGQTPSVIFGRGDDGRHGNFHPLADQAIAQCPQWSRRLAKVHTSSKRMKVRSDWQWKELDCANSSDALLMNIFCYPGAMASAAVCAMLGIDSNATPEFGFRPRTPLRGHKSDNTEIDMRVGDLLVEAKLTESDFRSANVNLVNRYRDLETVFDLSELPMRDGKIDCYQLLRGALAAYSTGCSFCVLCDSRRPDLIEDWYKIMRVVRLLELRGRLKLLTWQELAAVVPADLRQFLADKYGIAPDARLYTDRIHP